MGVRGIARKPFVDNDFHFAEFRFELDSFEQYLKMTNDLIEKQKFKIDEYESYGAAADLIFDSAEHNIRERTLRLYYSSIVISLYSFLEQSMYQLCKIAKSNNSVDINDIYGSGISKYKTYLEKVISIDFNPINSEWSQIMNYKELRDLFVHSSNTIIYQTNTKKRKNSIRGINGLKLKEIDDYLFIEFQGDHSIRNFIKIIKNFLIKVYYHDFAEFPSISN